MGGGENMGVKCRPRPKESNMETNCETNKESDKMRNSLYAMKVYVEDTHLGVYIYAQCLARLILGRSKFSVVFISQ